MYCFRFGCSPLYSAGVKNEWSNTSALPIPLLDVDRKDLLPLAGFGQKVKIKIAL
jgi:hypothetical protein